MTYWFDDLSEDELVANALLLGCRFMTEAERSMPGYGPYHRFLVREIPGHPEIGHWSAGYTSKGSCARRYLRLLEKRKAWGME